MTTWLWFSFQTQISYAFCVIRVRLRSGFGGHWSSLISNLRWFTNIRWIWCSEVSLIASLAMRYFIRSNEESMSVPSMHGHDSKARPRQCDESRAHKSNEQSPTFNFNFRHWIAYCESVRSFVFLRELLQTLAHCKNFAHCHKNATQTISKYHSQ